MSKITVVIPCYNDGRFLKEALESVSSEHYPGLFEQIVVDDGSTDPETRRVLSDFEERGINVLYQSNGGSASARNAGIRVAHGRYILPLDCDNKIDPEVFIEAMEFMDQHPEVDVVHTYARYFGEKEGIWTVETFNLRKLIKKNYIDTCALIRTSALIDVGMYENHSQYRGLEDWVLWIKMGIARKRFHLLPHIGFYYRARHDSISQTEVRSCYYARVEEVFQKFGRQILSVLKEDGYQSQDILIHDMYPLLFSYWRSLTLSRQFGRASRSMYKFSHVAQGSFLSMSIRFLRFLVVLTPYWSVKRWLSKP